MSNTGTRHSMRPEDEFVYVMRGNIITMYSLGYLHDYYVFPPRNGWKSSRGVGSVPRKAPTKSHLDAACISILKAQSPKLKPHLTRGGIILGDKKNDIRKIVRAMLKSGLDSWYKIQASSLSLKPHLGQPPRADVIYRDS